MELEIEASSEEEAEAEALFKIEEFSEDECASWGWEVIDIEES